MPTTWNCPGDCLAVSCSSCREELQDAASEAYPGSTTGDDGEAASQKQAEFDERRRWLRHDLTRLQAALHEFTCLPAL